MNDLPTILNATKTIAVVGASANPSRTSHAISRYLIEVGYTVIPVNPNYDTVHDLTSYPSLQAIPKDIQIDMVNVFRRPAETAGVVRDMIERMKETGERPVIWTQIGVSSREAEQLATDAGLDYVRNRCILVEHSRMPV